MRRGGKGSRPHQAFLARLPDGSCRGVAPPAPAQPPPGQGRRRPGRPLPRRQPTARRGTAGARTSVLTCGCTSGCACRRPRGPARSPARGQLTLGAASGGKRVRGADGRAAAGRDPGSWRPPGEGPRPRSASPSHRRPQLPRPAPLAPPPIVRSWAGPARSPARRMTLARKLPALRVEVRLQPRRPRRRREGSLPPAARTRLPAPRSCAHAAAHL